MALSQKPHPRAVVLGLKSGSREEATIRQMFPLADLVSSLSLVRQQDYDAVIIFGNPSDGSRSPTLHTFWIHGDTHTKMDLRNFAKSRLDPPILHITPGQRSMQFEIPPGVHRLAPSNLAETLEPKSRNYMRIAISSGSWSEKLELTPLLQEQGGAAGAIGLVVENTDSHRQIWILPPSARSHLGEWLGSALKQWQDRDPDAFPSHDWSTQADWMDSAERSAADRLARHDRDAAATIEALDRKRATLLQAQAAAQATASQGLRRLLTSNSDLLANTVMSTLKDLGFEVIDADKLDRPRKFEDLQVKDNDWICLAEVKGYERRNAKTADIVQLQTAASNYQKDHSPPSALWYIINQSCASPPDSRPKPFVSDPDTVSAFADNNGLVIDTRDLFRLATRVHQGTISRSQARELLRESRGVLELGPESTAEGTASGT